MAKYSEWVTYFKNLCIEHVLINHEFNGNKKFYRMNIEELYSGVATSLPQSSEGPFFVFINYIAELEQTGSAIKKNQMMFLILQHRKRGDFDQEEIAMNRCEEAAEDFVRRMKKDSQEGLDPFEYGFDVIEAKMIPAKIVGSTSAFVGWQVTFNPTASFNDCYDPTKFVAP